MLSWPMFMPCHHHHTVGPQEILSLFSQLYNKLHTFYACSQLYFHFFLTQWVKADPENPASTASPQLPLNSYQTRKFLILKAVIAHSHSSTGGWHHSGRADSDQRG